MKERKGLIISLLALAAIMAMAVIFINSIEEKTKVGRINVTRDAVRRAAVTCYCVEGRYPMSLDYLVKNYALAYDSKEFVIFYDAFATNIMPDISVEFRKD